MASINLAGNLVDPTGEFSVGDQIRFTHKSTTGDTIQNARSVLIIPPGGAYDIDLEFGNILVEYLDIKDVNYKALGVVTVNQDSTATTLPELLNAIVPPTDEQLLEFQAILADTTEQANNSANSAGAAALSETNAANSADAAALNGGVFDDTTAGLAGTSSGDYFSTPSAENDEYLILFKNNVGVADFIKTYPSTEAIVEVPNLVLSNDQNNSDRVEIVDDLLIEFNAEIFANTGTPKTQSVLYAGYATAITTPVSFDYFEAHIQLDAPTDCRVTIFTSALIKILSVDIAGVDGFNTVILPRPITSAGDDTTVYIGIDTINRDFMTTNTITAPPEYADTGTFPVKASPFGGDVGLFPTTVSSQFKIPFRIYNTRQLGVDLNESIEFQAQNVSSILAESLTTAMADSKGGALEDTFSNFLTTVAGFATPYLTPTDPFDAMRTVIRTESSTVLRFYLKNDTLGDIEFVDTELLSAGDHFLTIALSKLYTSAELGTQFYIAVESIGHVSRIAVRNFADDESKFPQPPNAFPLKSVLIAADENTWLGTGSGTSNRQYAEFFKLKNVSDSLSLAVANAEATSIQSMAIPANFYAILGLDNQNIEFANTVRSDATNHLFDISASNSGRMKTGRWQARPTGSGSVSIESKLYNTNRVLLSSRTSNLETVATTAGTGKTPKALFFGDSITARGFYTQDLLDLAAADDMGIELIGTLGTPPNVHEGIGGETVDFFFTDAASPFVFATVFDFGQYLSTNVLDTPDYVFMHLGTNDTFNLGSDADLDALTTVAFAQIESMITDIHSVSASIKLCIMLTIPASTDQDAYGIVFSDSATYWRTRANTQGWNNSLISQFDNRTGSEIYLVPTNCTLPEETAYNVADPIHPIDAGTGYQAMADTVWAFLKVKEL